MVRIPHPRSDTEVRQAFQQLDDKASVIDTGATDYILIGKGIGVAPVWEILSTAIDHGGLSGLADDDHTHYFLADGTRDLDGKLTITNQGNDTAPLGSELVTNGDFASDITNWTVGDGGAEWSWDATGKAQHNTGNTSTFYQGISVTNGQTYHVEFTTSSRTAGTLVLTFGAMLGSRSATGNTTYKQSFEAVSTGSVNLTFTPTTNWDGDIDDVTVKLISGTSDPLVLLEESGETVAAEIRGDSLSNLYIGTGAGQYNTTAVINLGVGTDALSSVTTGSNNTAIGANALRDLTTGIVNMAVGEEALLLSVDAVANTAIGQGALRTLVSGRENTAIGRQSLFACTGSFNTAVGLASLFSNIGGEYNTGLGRNALAANTEGDYNVSVGESSLRGITTGDYNVGIGYIAGRYIADGSTANKTTDNSVYIGYGTRASADGVTNEVAIGYNAIGGGTNTIVLGGSAVTTVFTPSLSVDGRIELTQQSGSTNDGTLWNDSTQEALQAFVSGIEQTLVGVIFTQTASTTIANTTTETTLFATGVGTLTLPANFWVVGKTIRIEIHGDIADAGNPTVEVQAYYGATSLIDSGAITLSGLAGTEEWECEVVITCRSVGATGTVETVIDWEYETSVGSSAIERLDVSGVLRTIDTTASGALDVTFQWGTAAAANTIESEVAFVEVLN